MDFSSALRNSRASSFIISRAKQYIHSLICVESINVDSTTYAKGQTYVFFGCIYCTVLKDIYKFSTLGQQRTTSCVCILVDLPVLNCYVSTLQREVSASSMWSSQRPLAEECHVSTCMLIEYSEYGVCICIVSPSDE